MIPEIVPVMEHFEVYINGVFYCFADNEREAKEEIKEYYKANNT